MKKVAILSNILALALLSGVAYADNNWYVELGGGYRYGTIDKGADVLIDNGQSQKDTYKPSSVTASGIIDLGFGYRFYTNDTTWFTHDDLGVRYQYITPATIEGVVDIASEADNFDYHYSLNQSTVFVVDKLAIVKLGAFIPYIQIGGGTSINQVSAYSETAREKIYVRDATFAANNYLKFAYMGGVGVDINLSPQWKLNVAYEYDSPSDIQTGFGSSNGNVLGQYLTNTVSNNEVTIGFQYLFGIKSFN